MNWPISKSGQYVWLNVWLFLAWLYSLIVPSAPHNPFGITCLDCLYDLTVDDVQPRHVATRDGHVAWVE